MSENNKNRKDLQESLITISNNKEREKNEDLIQEKLLESENSINDSVNEKDERKEDTTTIPNNGNQNIINNKSKEISVVHAEILFKIKS